MARDKRDADHLIRQHGDAAYERALRLADHQPSGSREARHWLRIAKIIKKRG